ALTRGAPPWTLRLPLPLALEVGVLVEDVLGDERRHRPDLVGVDHRVHRFSAERVDHRLQGVLAHAHREEGERRVPFAGADCFDGDLRGAAAGDVEVAYFTPASSSAISAP